VVFPPATDRIFIEILGGSDGGIEVFHRKTPGAVRREDAWRDQRDRGEKNEPPNHDATSEARAHE
jgi:hypothetical protein